MHVLAHLIIEAIVKVSIICIIISLEISLFQFYSRHPINNEVTVWKLDTFQ